MKSLRGLKAPLKVKGTIVCPGIFDGVHLGHQKVIRRAVREAKKCAMASVALTFEPHPSRVLTPHKPHPLLYSLEHRLVHLAEWGLDYCVIFRFTKRFSQISAAAFVKNILVKRLKAKKLFVGPDYRFGHRAQGNMRLLQSLGRRWGFAAEIIPPARAQGQIVSSTRIRNLVRKGHLKKASQLTGRPVSLYGTVIRGRGFGRKIGFPTLNLNVHHETLPPSGVYAIKTKLLGRIYKGVLHLGPLPTFKIRQTRVEVHLLKFHKSLYGKEIELILLKKIRAIRLFAAIEDLRNQIKRDVSAVSQALSIG